MHEWADDNCYQLFSSCFVQFKAITEQTNPPALSNSNHQLIGCLSEMCVFGYRDSQYPESMAMPSVDIWGRPTIHIRPSYPHLITSHFPISL